MSLGDFMVTGSTLNNPRKLGFFSRAEWVGVLRIWGFLLDSGGGEGFLRGKRRC
jgi:hypothetical protein